MTHSDLHMAVRVLLRGTPYNSFTVHVLSIEHHENRVTVEYVVQIVGLVRTFRSADPKRLIAWVRQSVKDAEADGCAPAALRAIGSAPRLRRVK